jgi:hypothetical protein
VTINAASTNTTEGVVDPAALVFTPENFATPQTVRVVGVNDNFVDGSVAYAIRLSVSSQDPGFANLSLANIAATNLDNDRAAMLSRQPCARQRDGHQHDLPRQHDRAAPRQRGHPAHGGQEGEAALSATALTFTTSNYNTPKIVTVRGLDDFIQDGDQPFLITLGPTRSNDPAFNSLRPASVRGVNQDNDRAVVTLSPTALTVAEGARGTVTVRLLTQPRAAVTVVLESATVRKSTCPASITLNASNYRQGVGCPCWACATAGGRHQLAQVRVRSLVSADRLYNVPTSSVTGVRVTVTDVDVPSIRVSPTALRVNEGGAADATATFRVVLAPAPQLGCA